MGHPAVASMLGSAMSIFFEAQKSNMWMGIFIRISVNLGCLCISWAFSLHDLAIPKYFTIPAALHVGQSVSHPSAARVSLPRQNYCCKFDYK